MSTNRSQFACCRCPDAITPMVFSNRQTINNFVGGGGGEGGGGVGYPFVSLLLHVSFSRSDNSHFITRPNVIQKSVPLDSPWWRHYMETFSALLAFCAGNSPPVPFDVFFICAWMNDWVHNREAGDLRCYRAHYDVTEMQMGPISMKRPPHHVWVLVIKISIIQDERVSAFRMYLWHPNVREQYKWKHGNVIYVSKHKFLSREIKFPVCVSLVVTFQWRCWCREVQLQPP